MSSISSRFAMLYIILHVQLFIPRKDSSLTGSCRLQVFRYVAAPQLSSDKLSTLHDKLIDIFVRLDAVPHDAAVRRAIRRRVRYLTGRDTIIAQVSATLTPDGVGEILDAVRLPFELLLSPSHKLSSPSPESDNPKRTFKQHVAREIEGLDKSERVEYACRLGSHRAMLISIDSKLDDDSIWSEDSLAAAR